MIDAPWRRDDPGAVVLMLHVQPGAKRTEVAGPHGEGAGTRLKIRLAAPPVDGKANAELLRYLAERVRRAAAQCDAAARRDVAAEDGARARTRQAPRPGLGLVG